jgi:hypothetical protein
MGANQNIRSRILLGALGISLALASLVQAANPPMVSQVVTMKSVGVDEFQEVLQGTDPAVPGSDCPLWRAIWFRSC